MSSQKTTSDERSARVTINPAILDETREAEFDKAVVEVHYYYPVKESLWRQIAVKGTAEVVVILLSSLVSAVISSLVTLSLTSSPASSAPKMPPPSATLPITCDAPSEHS